MKDAGNNANNDNNNNKTNKYATARRWRAEARGGQGQTSQYERHIGHGVLERVRVRLPRLVPRIFSEAQFAKAPRRR